MDVNFIRVAVMLAGFVLFLLLMAHTYSSKRRHEHDEAAQLPFRSDSTHGAPAPIRRPRAAGEEQ